MWVVTPAYARKSVYTDSGGGGGESQGNPTGGRRMPSFLGGRSGDAFRQPALIVQIICNLSVIFYGISQDETLENPEETVHICLQHYVIELEFAKMAI